MTISLLSYTLEERLKWVSALKHSIIVKKEFNYKCAKGVVGQYCWSECSNNPYDAARGADALIILTEWQEFKDLDLLKIKNLLKQPVIFDGRNIFNRERMRRLGFKYFSMGR